MRKYFLGALTVLLTMMAFVACTDQRFDIIEDLEETVSDPQSSTRSSKITLEEAIGDLKSLLADLSMYDSRSFSSEKAIESSFSISLPRASTRSGNEPDSIDIHVINFSNDEGFALMGGDISLPSLIALAEKGQINSDFTTDNPGLQSLLGNLYSVGGGRDSIPKPEIIQPCPEEYSIERGPTQNIVYKVGGYCPVNWGQGNPYNLFCPKVGDKNSLAGCVAVAVGQLMAVYQYPQSYNGYSFPWSEMIKYKSASLCNNNGQTGIARLLEQLGKSQNLSVSYGLEASGADFANIPRTLLNFNYSNCGNITEYSTGTVINELKTGYPLLVSAYATKEETKVLGVTVSTTYKDGHAWLLHGLLERRTEVRTYKGSTLIDTSYEKLWYPLCNFGWSGLDNGYYYTGLFNVDEGPLYAEYYEGTKGGDTLLEGTSNNFQYKIRLLSGIRK